MSWLTAHDGAVVLIQLGVWLATLIWATPHLRAALADVERRTWIGLAVLSLLAFSISAFGFPVFARYAALGHEASYLDCFEGRAAPGSEHGWEPYVTYPFFRWAYWAIGAVVGPERLEVVQVLNMAARGATVGALGLAAWALFGRGSAAIVAALLLAVHPTHAFWGTSIFNVPLPLFFAALCVLLATLAWRSGSPRLLAAAASTGCLVVATRVEFGLLAVGLAVLLFAGLGAAWGRHADVKSARFWAPTAAVLVVLGATVLAGLGALTSQGGYHDVAGYLATMGRQARFLAFFEPLQRPWAVVATGIGGVWAIQRVPGGGRLIAGLIGFVVLLYLTLATFNDFAFRHVLLPGFGAVLLASAAGPALVDALGAEGSRRVLAAVLGACLLGTLASSGLALRTNIDRYYMEDEEFRADHPGFALSELSAADLESGGCYLITDNERLWERGLAGSHFNLMEPGEAAQHWQEHDGCILWLYDLRDHRVDSLVVRSRALKLHHWFAWEQLGHARFEDGLEAVVFRMTSPPWGLSAPPPGWRWGDEEVGGEEERAEDAGDPAVESP